MNDDDGYYCGLSEREKIIVESFVLFPSTQKTLIIETDREGMSEIYIGAYKLF